MSRDERQCCRICAQKCNALISMFGEEGLFRKLMLKLRFCLQIIVEMEYSHAKQLTVTQQEEQGCDAHQDLSSPSECEPDHSKQCHCEQCVSQYGGLSLLAEVVDKNKAVSDASCSGSSHVTFDETKTGYLEATAERETPTRQTKKIISCEFCGKVFNHTGDLNKHRRRHTGERPYPCPQCDKRFSHASNLLRHQKIHSGETPHQCPNCARRFSRKDKMVNHIKKSRWKRGCWAEHWDQTGKKY
ncbi:zinc finger protein 773-like isoform X2 [Cryptotermes secundus]|uniref:zinc finger protein 773-like isoform X2 n=1 Tax=Cryptotermes secundus TaxID=105785 RepID=UPI000CD7D11D|nr:zinc finger protein 773-like isoform X2 [Cryptotermes secundus]